MLSLDKITKIWENGIKNAQGNEGEVLSLWTTDAVLRSIGMSDGEISDATKEELLKRTESGRYNVNVKKIIIYIYDNDYKINNDPTIFLSLYINDVAFKCLQQVLNDSAFLLEIDNVLYEILMSYHIQISTEGINQRQKKLKLKHV